MKGDDSEAWQCGRFQRSGVPLLRRSSVSCGGFGRHSFCEAAAVRTDRIHAVFHGILLHGPDESGHYERVGRTLTVAAL